MKTFNEFITELFDSPVKVKKIQTIGSHHHVYMFKVNNVPYHVHVQHLFADKTKADVDFGDRTKSPEESMTTTGSQGSHASKVFGAVRNALKMHNKENPHIKEYTFDASEEKSGEVNPARTRLYGAMARRSGGKAFGNSFKIPSSALQEEVDGGDNPFQKTVKAYKLFRTHPKHPGKLFPLFVNNKEPVEQGKWLKAKAGPPGKDKKKVKSSLGDLAYRPGWHSGDLPIATHIGGKSKAGLKKPDYRPSNHVWAEVEHPADIDWQSVANSRAQKTKAGKVKSETAHITDQVPHGGHYRYKTNPNMTGNWIISGDMKVNRVLSDDEVHSINSKAGVADLPRRPDVEAAKKTKKPKA